VKLLKSPTLRSLAVAVAAGGILIAFTQLLLPGSSGPARGTPMAVLFNGLVNGSLNALTAIGIVLIYRASRIVNFAQAALGAVGAVFAYNLIISYNWPYGFALAVGIVVSAVIALVVELAFIRRFFSSPRLVVTIVTIGIGTLLANDGVRAVANINIWGQQRDLVASFGGRDINPLPSLNFQIGDVAIPFGFAHVLTLGVLVAALLGIGAFLRFTRLGIAVRASSENAERAELLGINVRVLSTVVWVIAGALAGASITLLGTTQSFALGGQGAPSVLIGALTAAVVARMRSLPIAVYAAIVISMVQSAVGWSYRDHDSVVQAGLVIVIIIGLLAQRRTLQRAEEGSSWEATEEVRPTPRELLDISSVKTWRRGLIAAGALFVLVFPWTVESGLTNRGGLAAIFAIALLSLVVLTGWAGQASLGQFAFVAIGAMVGGAITSRLGLSFWLALPAGAVVAAIVAILIGLPALRIRGLFLAVVTLAFAAAVSGVLFDERYFGWLEPKDIRRPTLFFLDFEDERSMYYLAVGFLALVVVLVVTLRRSRPGRVMIALRENENDLQAFGINVVRTKLAAFALSGFICGLAGVLFAHHQRAVSETAFAANVSVNLFIYAIIGGVSSVTGALLGSTFQSIVELFPLNDPTLAYFVTPQFGLLIILYIVPGGLSGLAYAIRDSIYRIIATRRQIVVPSLMADFDPKVIEKQLIPLGATESDTGLDALGRGAAGYRLDSGLYDAEQDETDGRRGAPDDRSALGAAAARAAAED
jgi:branched-chain amino acid transport system permease protein